MALGIEHYDSTLACFYSEFYYYHLNGDTLQRLIVNQLPDPQIIDRIDSLLLLNGSYRKTFHFLFGASGFDSIIEGIGSKFGLLEPFDYGIGDFKVLRCFRSDSDLLISSGSMCSMTSDIIDVYHEMSVKLYPNPVKHSTTIKTNSWQNEPVHFLYAPSYARQELLITFVDRDRLRKNYSARSILWTDMRSPSKTER